MKKKPIVMMATTLIALLLLTPMVKAGVVHYWWDNVYYVDGTDIDYPHPDNVYYDISKTTDWTKLGYALYHCQINKDSTLGIIAGTVLLSGILGLAITAWLGGGTAATVAGGVTGLALMTLIPVVIDYYFVDERGCIWFWISVLFVNWLKANLSWLGPLCSSHPEIAFGEILTAFLCNGYLRVGMVTFHDALAIVGPQIYSLTISAMGTGTTHPLPGTYEYFEGTTKTVTADPGYSFEFSYWILDGTAQNENPIKVTMNSDHTLEAHFIFVGGGSGGCPILSVFDGSDYVTEGLLDIHNPDGIDLVYDHTLTTEPAWTTGAYQLRLTEHPQTHSYIDQVKLYATLEDETEIELPLIHAWHSEDGNVLPRLLFSDEWKTDTLGADLNNGTSQSIDLRFSALPSDLKVVSFVFQIEGHNVCHKR